MIKSKELRIDNMVHWNNEVYLIDSLSYDEILSLRKPNGSVTQCRHEDVEPIPITEDRLVDMGFKRKKTRMYLRRKYFSIDIDDYGYCSVWRITDQWHWSVYPKSVHQLQNLYFALTADELTFK